MNRACVIAFLVVSMVVERADAQPQPVDTPPVTSEATARIEKTAEDNKKDAEKALDDLDEKTSNFDKLRTPPSPAFTILGLAPSEIQRPTTPRAVAAALGQFVNGTDLVVPANFALEVAPYWLWSHPDLTLEQFQREDGRRWYRTLSVSVGTAQTKRTEMDMAGASVEHTDSDLGIGVRSVLFQSEFSTECRTKVNDYAQAVNDAATLTKAEIAKLEAEHGKGTPAFKSAAIEVQKQAVAAAQAGDQRIRKLLTTPKCVADGTLMRGWTVDVAAAIDWLAKDSKLTTDDTSWHRAAAWLNIARDADTLAGAGMVRFAAEKEAATQKVLDFGARGFYKAHSFALSAEVLGRFRFGGDEDRWTYKADLAIEYEVADGTWLSVSLGKDFAFTPTDIGSLFTLANLQWNLGEASIGK